MKHVEARVMALGASVLVVLAVLAGALAGRWHPQQRPDYGWGAIELPMPTMPAVSEPTPSATPVTVPSESEPLPPWVTALLIVVALVLLFFLGRWATRRVRAWLAEQRLAADQGGPSGEFRGAIADLAIPALDDALTHAADALDRPDVPPGDAVIAAWVALEHAAERSGLERDPAATATEFTLELLDATQADPGASRTLLDLYLAARYSDHRVTPADVEVARGALAQITRGVRRSRSADETEPDDDTEPADESEPDDESEALP